MPAQPAFSPKEKTHREQHEAHVAELQRSTWRVGVVDGRWRLAQHDGSGWLIRDESIPHDPDLDMASVRYRLSTWLRATLGHRSAWLHRDYEAAKRGRLAFHLTINS